MIRLTDQKTKTEVTILILNENLITICEKYGYNIPKVNEHVLNRYIKDILKDLSEQLPTLKAKMPTKLTMKQTEALRKEMSSKRKSGFSQVRGGEAIETNRKSPPCRRKRARCAKQNHLQFV